MNLIHNVNKLVIIIHKNELRILPAPILNYLILKNTKCIINRENY